MSQRLFAALDCAAARDAIADWWAQASLHLDFGCWREIPVDNWHCTLAFYGEVAERDIDNLCDALADCASRAQPLALQLDGFGLFPSAARPRVFWIGVSGADAASTRALARLARCCVRAGHATLRNRMPARSRFTGHVTLARSRGDAASHALDRWSEMPQPPSFVWNESRLQLYRSRLAPEGARYQVLEEYRLGE
ncbi:MAG: RNA 2',3'-cyclic phosphodiesterase [Mariprofundaceae bacterium]